MSTDVEKEERKRLEARLGCCLFCGNDLTLVRPGVAGMKRWTVWCTRCGFRGPTLGRTGYVNSAEEVVVLYFDRGDWGRCT